jgi:hypothetical protein
MRWAQRWFHGVVMSGLLLVLWKPGFQEGYLRDDASSGATL